MTICCVCLLTKNVNEKKANRYESTTSCCKRAQLNMNNTLKNTIITVKISFFLFSRINYTLFEALIKNQKMQICLYDKKLENLFN